jgi:chitodextrinase
MLIRRRPSAATLVAIIITLVIGSQTGLAAGSSRSDRDAPDPVRSVEVTATDGSSVTIAWPALRDRNVAGYTVSLNGARVADLTPDQLTRWRIRDTFTYTLQRLACGTGYTVAVDAFDRDDRHSLPTSTTVSTAACPDTTAPSAPSGIRQVAATENSVMLTWTASTDNVGVVEYGLYTSGLRVASSSDASATLSNLTCATSYLVAIDATDAAGNRSAQATTYLRTSACPSTNKPPSTPTGLKVTAATATSVSLAWTASTDDVGVGGYGLYVSGKRTGETTRTSATYSGLQCGTTYALGVDAYDTSGKRSTVAELSTATSPCTTTTPPPTGTATVTQTITNGSTIPNIANWRAVYDRNADGREDDPGKIEFRVDGQLILTEELIPFGDSFDSSWPVSPGSHTFQVRALSDTGTLLASNTVTATVGTTTTPPPTGDTTPPSLPTNLRVTSATATSATVTWNAATDNVGVTGYDIYRGGTKVGSATTTSYLMNGLTCGTVYSVGIRAFDSAGNASPQATLSVTTSACADTQPPTPPGNVTASNRTATSISLTWAPASDNVGVAGYGLYNGGELVNTTAGTTGIVGGLTCGTNYTLAVDAFDASGNSSSKTTVMVSTLACADTSPPTQPTNLRLTAATTTSATLAWNAATDNVGVTGYDVLRAGTKVGSTTTTSYLMNGLTCGTTYSVAVKALDSAGNASPQATASITTSACAAPAPAPSGFPDASNTGVPAGTSLTVVNGNLNVNTAGQVVDARDVRGCIIVNASGVTVRNTKAECIIIDNSALSGPRATFVDSEIRCDPTSWNTGIRFGNFNATRLDISNCENGLDIGSNVSLKDSYIHDLAQGGSLHADGIQGAIRNAVIEHNTIYGFTGTVQGTSAIIASGSSNTNTVIRNNLMAGGAYTLYCPRVSGGDPSFQVLNNYFSTISSPKVGAFGALDSCNGETLSGNAYYESGQPLTSG